MPNLRHIPTLVRAAARLLLGALLFLVLASYLAVPCMTRDASQFQSIGSLNSCTEHQLFKPQADLKDLFSSFTPGMTFRLPIALVAMAAPFLIALLLRPVAHDRLKRRRRIRAARLPFATAHPPKLPQFAALRDA